MVGWHHWLNGHEFEQILGDDEGEGSLVCCIPRGPKQSDTMKWLNNKDNNSTHFLASWWFNICLHTIGLKNLDDSLLLWQLEPSHILLGRKTPRANACISILPLAGRLLYTGGWGQWPLDFSILSCMKLPERVRWSWKEIVNAFSSMGPFSLVGRSNIRSDAQSTACPGMHQHLNLWLFLNTRILFLPLSWINSLNFT